MRMSMSGLSRWKASSRGISHMDANEAKVVSDTLLRPALWRICAPRRRCAAATAFTAISSCAPGAGQLHRPGVAQKQGHAHLFFQRLDLPADGGLGQRHFFGRRAEVQVPRHGLEGAQVAGRDGPGAQVGLGMLHGSKRVRSDGAALMRIRNQ
jgi:hypothetical protein